jgi:anti-sigma factor RsiW
MTFTDRQCEETREGLSAMIDGAVSPAEEAALRRHLDDCFHCAAYERSLRELEAQMDAHLTEQCDEDKIWTRVLARINTYSDDAMVPTDGARLRVGVPFWRWVAPAVLVCGLALGAWHMMGSTDAPRSILAATVEDFDDFRSAGDVLDVAGSHPDAVRRWMTARVDFELPEGIASPAGLRIAGGRLCSFLDRQLAFFSYDAGNEKVGLYITPAEGLEVPRGGSLVAITRDDGLSAVSWFSDGLAYVAVSERPMGDLALVAAEFREGAIRDL